MIVPLVVFLALQRSFVTRDPGRLRQVMTAERLMVAFAGTQLAQGMALDLLERPYAGVTLFRAANIESPDQIRQLAEDIQAVAQPGRQPLLIAADQEGGQLNALGDGPTQFAGAMALGAADDEELTERVARATGRELRALGVNVNYAPVCDLATNPDNPALGIRAFGDDAQAVGRHVAATVNGLQAEGVAAVAKHFPGIGGAELDTHHALAVLEADPEQFEQRELIPFRAAIAAGAWLVMTGHAAAPGLTGDVALPASLSAAIVSDLLRGRFGFTGLTITDALDMRALAQGADQMADVIRAVQAGQDLLLATPDAAQLKRLDKGLAQAEQRGLLTHESGRRSQPGWARCARGWLDSCGPTSEVVGCAEHRALAAELAALSITLVRDDGRLLPLRLAPDARVAVVQPAPTNVTPADTTANVEANHGRGDSAPLAGNR